MRLHENVFFILALIILSLYPAIQDKLPLVTWENIIVNILLAEVLIFFTLNLNNVYFFSDSYLLRTKLKILSLESFAGLRGLDSQL